MPSTAFANVITGPEDDLGRLSSVTSEIASGDDFPASPATTGEVTVDGTATGDIETANDRDWFAVTLTEGQTVQISQNGVGLTDPYLRLRNASGTELAANDDGGAGLDSLITFTVPSNGLYYIEAGAYGSNTGTYQIEVTEVQPEAYDPLDTINWGTRVSNNNVTVYFGTAGFSEGGFIAEGFNAYEVARFRAAFDEIEAVSNLTFTFANAPSGADFRMILDTNEMESGLLGLFYPPGNGLLSGLGVFNGSEWDRSSGGTLEAGGLGYQTIAHEVLHGLGLAHPHDTGGSSEIMPGVSAPFNTYGQDGLNQGVYTTMSYNRGFNLGEAGTGTSFDYVYGAEAGPMALDIALLQQAYGANTTTASGNNVYALDRTNGAGTHWHAIWDTGGIDVVRYVGTQDVFIDLRAATLLGEEGGGGYLSRATGIAGGFTIAAGVEIENATGGSGDDTLIGNAGDNILRGGAGADSLIGGAGIDTVDYTGSRGSLRVDLMFADINTNIAEGDTYDSIENLIGSQGFDNLRGTFGDNQIQGMANVDYIFGRRGVDTLEGGIGDDVLFGGVGADMLIGGVHRDRAQYSESLTALVLDLMNSGNNTGEAAGDSYDSIEDLAGGSFADVIYGDLSDNRLFGREGSDQLFGRAGDDYLNGGAHADRLDGGAGNDTLRGGSHNDTFVFNGGNDVVEDFNHAHTDRIAIQASEITSVAGLTAQQVVDNFANIVGGQVVFDFGGGNALRLESLDSLSDLAEDVLIF
ncbi:pre-peptidase C-terminal domain-containing protein [Sulfitobacter indolifex]|uniref:pre-peptidase C-terminal domain-containing protein n=1 Tax=Sulfitobacter indolifex TaxID=225422 RepID=UPI001049F783|nr:pre-peptidase C-terminal domain-containing protein [Sulfitobacter indolifex]